MTYNIDKIIYINLNKREDRKLSIENELDNYGFKNYERFEAIETLGMGFIGCANSHLSVLKIAKERNYKNILILEDDFVFSVNKTKLDILLDEFFQINIPYDVCMLSYNLNEFLEIDNSVVNKILFSQTASGYIVNSNYYNVLIELYEWAMPLLMSTRQHWIYANDIVWEKYQRNDNWVYFKNRIGKQRAGFSDNSNNYSDYGV